MKISQVNCFKPLLKRQIAFSSGICSERANKNTTVSKAITSRISALEFSDFGEKRHVKLQVDIIRVQT